MNLMIVNRMTAMNLRFKTISSYCLFSSIHTNYSLFCVFNSHSSLLKYKAQIDRRIHGLSASLRVLLNIAFCCFSFHFTNCYNIFTGSHIGLMPGKKILGGQHLETLFSISQAAIKSDALATLFGSPHPLSYRRKILLLKDNKQKLVKLRHLTPRILWSACMKNGSVNIINNSHFILINLIVVIS